MSNLGKNLLIGLAGGVLAGVALTIIDEEPKLPSALVALGRKLAPIGDAILADLQREQPDEEHHDEQPADEVATTQPEAASSADQGHPAGPGFAPTPA